MNIRRHYWLSVCFFWLTAFWDVFFSQAAEFRSAGSVSMICALKSSESSELCAVVAVCFSVHGRCFKIDFADLSVLTRQRTKKNKHSDLGRKTVCRSRVVRWTFPRSSSISRCPDVCRTTFHASSSTAHLVNLVLGFIEGLCDRDILSYRTSSFYMLLTSFNQFPFETDIIGVVSITAWHPAICFHLLSVLNTVWRPCRVSNVITPISSATTLISDIQGEDFWERHHLLLVAGSQP